MVNAIFAGHQEFDAGHDVVTCKNSQATNGAIVTTQKGIGFSVTRKRKDQIIYR